MATLAALKRQIAKLTAEVERKTRAEMSEAIAKVHEIMSTYGLTTEHLSGGSSSGPGKKGKVTKASPMTAGAKRVKVKAAGAGTPKYRDPKSGATWTGFGRAPGWLAAAKSRDAFLIHQPASDSADATDPAHVAGTKKLARRTAKNVVATSKTAVAKSPVVAAKKARAKTASSKTTSKPSAAKRPAAKASPARKAVTAQAAAAVPVVAAAPDATE